MPQEILLTADDVRRWRRERDQHLALAAALTKKLEAAALFMEAPVQAAAGGPAEPALSLNDRIAQVIGASSRPLTPKQIRQAVSQQADGVLGSENYLYTAIKRLADRGKIVKTPLGYTSATNSPKGEAGETASPPGSLINQERPFQGTTPEGGAVEPAPEAGGT